MGKIRKLYQSPKCTCYVIALHTIIAASPGFGTRDDIDATSESNGDDGLAKGIWR